LAVENDRRRLLRRCLNEWQLWCRMERSQRDLLARQQETKVKMAALINAAATGKLTAIKTSADTPESLLPEPKNQEDTGVKIVSNSNRIFIGLSYILWKDHSAAENEVLDASTQHQGKASVGHVGQALQPWHVTRCHAAPTAAELQDTRRRIRENGVLSTEGRSENRHAVHQQIITQQRKLLKKQQEQIAQLKEKQSLMVLELEMEKTVQLTQLSLLRKAKSCSLGPGEQRLAR
ncbi:hypothetical protein GOODEAATRI_020844, partial [Goodea atripinnis]